MPYYPTQKDIQALGFSEKIILVRIVLLNNQLQSVYELKYEYISGDMTTDTDSDIRNTFSMTLAACDESVGIAENKKLWIDKFIKVFIGIKVPCWEETLWYDKGIFVMTDYSYDAINRTLHINCSDLVCALNGDVGGSLEGLETIIYEADKHTIRYAIIETLTDLTPFRKYYIEDMSKLIPFDLEFGATDTVWTILTKLRDLYPGYEMFFDTDGTFICCKVSTLESDPVLLDDSILQPLYLSETDNGDLKDIRNVSKVWGKCLDTDYFTDTCTYDASSNTYSAHFTGIAVNEDGSLPTSTKFAVKIPTTNTDAGTKLAIYNKTNATASETLVSTLPITDSLEQEIKKGFFLSSRSFVFRYRRKSMYVMGQWQIFAVNKLRNTAPTTAQHNADKAKHGCDDITYTIISDSPFAIERIGERLKTFEGGEYDDIQAIADCITRAEYETWLAAKIGYTITLEMVYIPWLQGNEKIRFTLAATGETKDWVVTSISTSLSEGTMTLTLTEFMPLYNFEVVE